MKKKSKVPSAITINFKGNAYYTIREDDGKRSRVDFPAELVVSYMAKVLQDGLKALLKKRNTHT